MMEFGHPHTRAFWEPVRAGIAAGIFGGLFGLGLGMLAGSADPVPGAVAWAGGTSLAAWTIDHLAWMKIVARSYAPAAPEPEPEPEPEEQQHGDTYMVRCQAGDGNTFHFITGLPIHASQLWDYAAGLREGKRPVFQDWTRGPKPTFRQDEYQAFIAWMRQRGWASGEPGETPEFTERGKDILADVLKNGIQDYSPTETLRISNI